MKRVTLFLALLMLVSCSKKASETDLYKQAEEMYQSQKFEEAVFVFDQMLADYPEGTLAPKAAFMMGYIYANELSQMDFAKEFYQLFLEKYGSIADSNLVNSALWELENLGRNVDDLEILTAPDEDAE
jgi:outer membrane protein assembly factor BamD (BamD/ComL family)